MRAAEQDRPDIAAARRALRRRQTILDPRKLVFATRSTVGAKGTAWELEDSDIQRHDRVTAPFVLQGAMNGETFKAYIEQFLAPTLKRGDIVLMDNVSVHQVDGSKRPSKPAVQFPFTCPRTVPTSIPSSNYSQS